MFSRCMFTLMGQCKLTKVEFKYLGQVTCILPVEEFATEIKIGIK